MAKKEVKEDKIMTDKIVLRAFKITNPHVTEKTSGVRKKLEKILTTEHSADKRCLILNPNDINKEQDLISDYSSNGDNQSIFCTLLRMKLGNRVQHITDDLLSAHKFSLNDLKQRTIKTAGIYQRHYYFSILGDFLVTGGMPLNQTIKQLQTYLAWLLEDETLEITPMIESPKECKLSDLTSAIFKDPDFDSDDSTTSENTESKDLVATSEEINTNITETKTSWLNQKTIQKILPQILQESLKLKDIDDLAKIVSAQLVVKFSKPRKMAKEDYEKILGATLKPVGDIENVEFKTKDKKRIIKGKDLLKSKIIEIEKTETGYLSEEQLKQAMAHYLREISQ